MKHYIFHAKKWRQRTPQRNSRIEKMINILRSCQNAQQLNIAWKFVSEICRNSIERDEMFSVYLDTALNDIKDLTATFTQVEDKWEFSGMFVKATGIIKDGTKEANRVVFLPSQKEIEVKHFKSLDYV